MTKKRYSEFTSEILSLYVAPLRSRRTRGKLKQVLEAVGGLPKVRSTADLTPTTVAAFVESLAGLNPNTVNGYLGYLRRACGYAVAMGYLRVNPFSVHGFRLRERDGIDRHLSAAEVDRLLDHLAKGATSWAGRRLHALVATYAFTGVRRDEALNLLVADVALAERIIYLTDRTPLKTEESAVPVPMPEALAEILAAWLPATGSVHAFPNVTRTGPWVGGSWGKRALDEAQAAARAVGIEGFTFQGLRQTWATMAESHWDFSEPLIQRVLRHTTPKTQRRYRKADLPNLTAAVRSIHFRAS